MSHHQIEYVKGQDDRTGGHRGFECRPSDHDEGSFVLLSVRDGAAARRCGSLRSSVFVARLRSILIRRVAPLPLSGKSTLNLNLGSLIDLRTSDGGRPFSTKNFPSSICLHHLLNLTWLGVVFPWLINAARPRSSPVSEYGPYREMQVMYTCYQASPSALLLTPKTKR